jgi:hypothetical protein
MRRSLESAQYTSIEFGHRCRTAGVRPSMGSVGDAYDNAMCESFFATLECELLDRCRFKTQVEARNATFAFRLHAEVTPQQIERALIGVVGRKGRPAARRCCFPLVSSVTFRRGLFPVVRGEGRRRPMGQA